MKKLIHPHAPSKKKLLLIVSLTFLYLLIVYLLHINNITCLYKYFFDIPCPGCGMTRAYLYLLRLDFSSAFSCHPMFWSVPVLYLYILFDGKLFNKKCLDNTILALIFSGFFINYFYTLFF